MTTRERIRRVVVGCLREPLLHFAVLGALLFLLYAQVRDSATSAPNAIVVTEGQIQSLVENWQRVWQRPPTQPEIDGLIEDHIREEVLYREALAMGLDRDDTIVRRRMRQKLDFIAEGLVDQMAPTEAELQAFLAGHPDLFRRDDSFSFRQVFLDPARRQSTLAEDIRLMLNDLNAGGPTPAGDSQLLPARLDAASASEIAAQFGDEFAAGLAGLETGKWLGPVNSGFGVHLVFVEARAEGGLPELAAIRDAVVREWAAMRRRETNEVFYRALRDRYDITVESITAPSEP